MVWYIAFLAFGCTTLYICRKTDEESLNQHNRFASSATFLGVLVVIVMAFMAGFRNRLGTDYENYVDIMISIYNVRTLSGEEKEEAIKRIKKLTSLMRHSSDKRVLLTFFCAKIGGVAITSSLLSRIKR